MAKAIFTAYDLTNSETDLHAHNGQEVTVLGGVKDSDSVMYRVQFTDGFEAEAFDEELTIVF